MDHRCSLRILRPSIVMMMKDLIGRDLGKRWLGIFRGSEDISKALKRFYHLFCSLNTEQKCGVLYVQNSLDNCIYVIIICGDCAISSCLGFFMFIIQLFTKFIKISLSFFKALISSSTYITPSDKGLKCEKLCDIFNLKILFHISKFSFSS